MAKPEPDFTMGALLAELQKGLPISGDCWAMSELIEALGGRIGRSAIQRRLHILDNEGRLEPGRKLILNIGRESSSVICYRLKADDGSDNAG